MMEATILTKVTGQLLEAKVAPRDPLDPPVVNPPDQEEESPDPEEEPALPTTRHPYFDLGDAQGKVGELVSIPMIGGCRHPVNGLHIGIGLDGYGNFKMEGFTLGDFLKDYFAANNMLDSYWSGFNMVSRVQGALPTEWCDVVVAMFSISQKRAPLPSIQIPVETELFSFQIRILEGAALGEHELTCLDEVYFTRKQRRRRDFLFTTDRESEFARGGVTKISTHGGILTVVA